MAFSACTRPSGDESPAPLASSADETPTRTHLHEHDFAQQTALRATPEDLVVVHLEHPNDAHSTGALFGPPRKHENGHRMSRQDRDAWRCSDVTSSERPFRGN